MTELKIIVYLCTHYLKGIPLPEAYSIELLTWKSRCYCRSGYLCEICLPVVSPSSSNGKSIDNGSEKFWFRVLAWEFLRLIGKIEFIRLNC